MDTRAEADTLEGKRARDAAAATAREGGASAIADSMLPKLVGPSTRTEAPEIVEQVRAMVTATPVPGIVGALGAMRDRPDSTEDLAGLDGLPTLILVGEEDEVIPPVRARAMAEAIPGARLVVVPERPTSRPWSGRRRPRMRSSISCAPSPETFGALSDVLRKDGSRHLVPSAVPPYRRPRARGQTKYEPWGRSSFYEKTRNPPDHRRVDWFPLAYRGVNVSAARAAYRC